jgi:rhomboid protease GluP
MDSSIVIFWFVTITCSLSLIFSLLQIRTAVKGWALVFLGILLVAISGKLGRANGLIYLSLGLWIAVVLTPGLLARLFNRFSLQQRYSHARRVAQVISWLHPFDGWRDQPKMVHALELAQKGEIARASEILNRYKDSKSLSGILAIMNLYRLTHQWEEFVGWEAEHEGELKRYPQLLPMRLRARGETGDLRGLAELYEQEQNRIAKLAPLAYRDFCRLSLFAFCGQRELTERLLAGSLAALPESTRKFWLATADLAAGNAESARLEFQALLSGADPSMRLTIQRRLSAASVPPGPLDAAIEGILESARLEHRHEQSFGARPSLFSKHARATQLLIALNLAVFTLEVAKGGATNGETLYRLGALYPAAVHSGEVWRLLAALFLHFGTLHLCMNMFALWVLSPFVEFALGFLKFMLVYLVTGIGSMALVMWFANPEQLTVGASGAVMGLIGATGALMLRAWIREKAFIARRRLRGVFLIVAMQTIFDAAIPQVSMTAHLSGVAIGFLITLILPDRLLARRPSESARNDVAKSNAESDLGSISKES